MSVNRSTDSLLELRIETWGNEKKWTELSKNEPAVVEHTVKSLKPNTEHGLFVSNKLYKTFLSDSKGTIGFNYELEPGRLHTFEIR